MANYSEVAKVGSKVRCESWMGYSFTPGKEYLVGEDGQIEDNLGGRCTPGQGSGDWSLVPAPSPIRTETVTIRRIEPGVYGRLRIDHAHLTAADHVAFDLVDRSGCRNTENILNAAELREVARVALECAEYLENGR